MLERWLYCPLYYGNTLSLPLAAGGPDALEQLLPCLEPLALIVDFVATVLLKLHRDLPRTEHLLSILCPMNVIYKETATALIRLARAAQFSTGAAREILEEVLLRQGRLVRWIGGAERVLKPDQAPLLVALARCLLLNLPGGEPGSLAVDAELASQVKREGY